MDDRRHPLQHVLEGGRFLLRAQQPSGAGDRRVQRLHRRPFEPLAVGAAVHVADGVGEALHGPLVPGAPAEGHLHLGASWHVGLHHAVLVGGVLLVGALTRDHQRARHRPITGGRQEVHHVGQPVGEVEGLLADAVLGGRAQHVGDTGHQEGGVPQFRPHPFHVQRGAGLEVAGVVPVADRGAGGLVPLHLPRDVQAGPRRELGPRPGAVEHAGGAVGEGHLVDQAVTAHRHVEPVGQGVHRGGADAVQATGCLVPGTTELAARVQPGEDQLHPGDPGLGVHPGGDSSAVVVDLDAAVGVQGDDDAGGVPGHTLVGRVVHDLAEEVVDAPAVGRSDVHARTFADRLQALQMREVIGPVDGFS